MKILAFFLIFWLNVYFSLVTQWIKIITLINNLNLFFFSFSSQFNCTHNDVLYHRSINYMISQFLKTYFLHGHHRRYNIYTSPMRFLLSRNWNHAVIVWMFHDELATHPNYFNHLIWYDLFSYVKDKQFIKDQALSSRISLMGKWTILLQHCW